MTERVLPLADGAPACPFVAFEDDRDERASVPDHRHRCYADARPAPRALAHQEAYCLSSAFPVCPTFQDWARREAARSRGGPPSAPSASAGMNRAAGGAALAADAASSAADRSGDLESADDVAGAGAGPGAGAGAMAARPADAMGVAAGATGPAFATDDDGPIAASTADEERVDDPRRGADARDAFADDFVRRNPPRDWSAPPPWLASDEARRRDDSEPPAFLGRRASEPGQGLAGSPADRMAGGSPPTRRDDTDGGVWSSDSRSAAAMGAGLAAGAADPSARRAEGRDIGSSREGALDEATDEDDARRVTRRPRAYAQHLGGPDGPDWERPRRYEDYPVIRTRVGLPAVPRIAALTGVVVVLALALFFFGPVILNLGGGSGTPAASSGASQGPVSSASFAPTVPPAPTPTLYTIKHNDTLSKIATAHGITIEELMAANPTIKNPDRISEGQQITIPLPSEPPPDTIDGSAAP